MFGDIREDGNDLLLWWKFGGLLEFEVANGSGECQVAIDTTKIDKASCGSDSCPLG
jgi:hypothetical protein